MKPCTERWNERLIGWVSSAGDETHISGAERSAIESHLESCGACRSAVRALKAQGEKMDGSVAELVRVEPSPEFRARLSAAVTSSRRAPIRALEPRWAWVGLAAAAAAVALLQGRGARDVDDANEELRVLRESAAMIANWHSPTDSLTRPPGPTGLRPPLRFGEFYFTFPGSPAVEQEDENETERDG